MFPLVDVGTRLIDTLGDPVFPGVDPLCDLAVFGRGVPVVLEGGDFVVYTPDLMAMDLVRHEVVGGVATAHDQIIGLLVLLGLNSLEDGILVLLLQIQLCLLLVMESLEHLDYVGRAEPHIVLLPTIGLSSGVGGIGGIVATWDAISVGVD